MDKIITCKEIAEFTSKEEVLRELREFVKSGLPIKLPENLKEFSAYRSEISIVKNCLMYRNRVVIPTAIRENVLKILHKGHPGIVAMKAIVRSLIWYPGLEKDIVNLISNCKSCQLNAARPNQNQIFNWPNAPRIWSRLHVDHFFMKEKYFLF